MRSPIHEPFEAAFGTKEWEEEANVRIQRVNDTLLQVVTRLLAEQSTYHLRDLQHELHIAIEDVIQSKELAQTLHHIKTLGPVKKLLVVLGNQIIKVEPAGTTGNAHPLWRITFACGHVVDGLAWDGVPVVDEESPCPECRR